MIDILQANYPALLAGALTTLWLSLLAIVVGGVLGLILAFGLRSETRAVRLACGIYRSFWRGTPILVQLLIVFYVLPRTGLEVSPILAALIALSLNTAAFQGEIYRAGLAAIPLGQIEAARILGFGRWSIIWRVEIPQMLRLVMPPLVNETIIIIKNSSLVSVIAVTELMRRGQQIAATTFMPMESYLLVGLIYLTINISLASFGRHVEKRLSVGGAAA